MTKFDQFVRQMILEYPSLFKNRTDVLRHTFCVIGNGMEWGKDGMLMHLRKPKSEKACRERFFEDLDRLGEFREESRISEDVLSDYYAQQDAVSAYERAERALLLEHLDAAVYRKTSGIGWSVYHIKGMYYAEYWRGMNVPENAEPSFAAGAKEALTAVLYSIRQEKEEDNPMVQEIRAYVYQRWPLSEKQKGVIRQMLKALKKSPS